VHGWAAHAPEWITIALLAGAFMFARRFGGGAALTELELANKVLVKAVAELRADNVRLTAEVASLRASRDVGVAILPVLEALRLHEERAGERAEKTLGVLGLIADRLGPEAQAA
jgi:hypothetical protein